MPAQQYEHWELNEFLTDPSFQDWVLGREKNETLNAHWLAVQANLPHLAPVMEEARELLLELAGYQPVLDPEGEDIVWQQIQATLHKKAPRRARLFQWKYAAAALAPFLGLLGWMIWQHHKGAPQVVTTAGTSGTFRIVHLPDSSQVMLGAHSNIRYQSRWNGSGPREVWLKGDAHFEIRHLNADEQHVAPQERFLVHVNDVEIEVLGTVFNVWNHHGRTEVQLESGKVKVSRKGTEKALILQPGDIAEASGTQLLLRNDHPELVPQGGAHDKLMQLNNTSVAEIIRLIEETYGKKVMVSDSSLLTRRIDGVLPLCHEKDLLFALSGILDIQVKQTDAHTWVFITAE